MLSARKIALLGIDSPVVSMLCATDGFVSSATVPIPIPLPEPPTPPIYLGGGGGGWSPLWPTPAPSTWLNWWKDPEEPDREGPKGPENTEHVIADTIIDPHGIERQVRIRYDDNEKEALKDKGTDWLAERVIVLEGKDLARESAQNWTVTNGQKTFKFFVHKPYPADDSQDPALSPANTLGAVLVSAAAFAVMWAAGHD